MVSHSLCQPALPVHPAHLCPQPRLDCAWFTHLICPSRAVVLDVHAEGVIVSFATEACHPAFLGGVSAQRILSLRTKDGEGRGEREWGEGEKKSADGTCPWIADACAVAPPACLGGGGLFATRCGRLRPCLQRNAYTRAWIRAGH